MILTTYLQKSGSVGSNRYIPSLTGLRALAAYLVFLHHYNPALPGTFAHRLFAQGYIGVSIFFVLSGFLIYHRYAGHYFTQNNWSWRKYLQHRFARIFPLYVLIFLITAGSYVVTGQSMSLAILGLNLTVLKGFFDDYKFSGIAQSWSLTVEVCFYLLAPFLFIRLRRWGVIWLTTGLVSIGLILWATTGQLAWHGLFGSLPFVLFYTFFGRSFEFVVGMWLAALWQQKSSIKCRFATFGGLFVISICVLWQASVPLFTANPAKLVWSEVFVYNYLLPVGIGIFFLGLLHENSFVHYVLSRPVLQTLGCSSYAFYLIHIGSIASGFQRLGITHIGVLFCLLIVTSHGLYIFIEKPLHHHLKR